MGADSPVKDKATPTEKKSILPSSRLPKTESSVRNLQCFSWQTVKKKKQNFCLTQVICPCYNFIELLAWRIPKLSKMPSCVAGTKNNNTRRTTYLLDNRKVLSHSFLNLLLQPTTNTNRKITLPKVCFDGKSATLRYLLIMTVLPYIKWCAFASSVVRKL